MVGIYKVTNLVNGNSYIGQSRNIEGRWKAHRTTWNISTAHEYNYPLYRAIRKYGLENFSFQVLEECSIELLNDREKYWIQYYDTFFNGYNQGIGGSRGPITIVGADVINGIVKDLENTSDIHRIIAARWNVSTEMVQGINTGRYWRMDREYPIQKYSTRSYNGTKQPIRENRYCIDCGAAISKKATRCLLCYNKYMLRAKRPAPMELAKEIIEHGFSATGRKYGVSDNTIRNWCKAYNMPTSKEQLKNWIV